MSRAASEINLSQPGITQSIESLETDLNVRLFERRRSGCYATEFGAMLLPRVQSFFEQVRSALTEQIGGSSSNNRHVSHKITRPQIRSLLAISESDSFDAAARRLQISQPSLYRSAKELERELRRSLYQRTARGMTTNLRGKELARRFQVALREIEYGLEELKAAQGDVVSRIAIGNIPHSDTQVLSAAVNELLSLHPNARIEIVDGHYDGLLNDLRAARLDLLWGVLRVPAWANDVTEEMLFPNPYVVIARKGHALNRTKRITLHDLARYEWIMPGRTTPRRQAFERMFGGMRRVPRVSIETTSLQLYRNILGSSDRLTLMSRLEAQLNDASSLAVLPFQSPHLRRSDGFVRRNNWRPTDIHLQFVGLLRKHARRLLAAVDSVLTEVPGRPVRPLRGMAHGKLGLTATLV